MTFFKIKKRLGQKTFILITSKMDQNNHHRKRGCTSSSTPIDISTDMIIDAEMPSPTLSNNNNINHNNHNNLDISSALNNGHGFNNAHQYPVSIFFFQVCG